MQLCRFTVMNKGKLIVIEGTDGSGKATQAKLLIDWLLRKKTKIETLDFPQYGNPSAFFVEKYLRGEFGKSDEVGPYRGSVFYSLDRYDKSFEIKKWLEKGKIVISNRYTSASMGHQAGKIDDLKERDTYLQWLTDFEYRLFEIPKPDITIFLYMPPEIGQQLVDQKVTNREYTKGKKRDIHENDISHLKKASDAFLYVAKRFHWSTIPCFANGKIRTKEDIHEEIKKMLKERNIL